MAVRAKVLGWNVGVVKPDKKTRLLCEIAILFNFRSAIYFHVYRICFRSCCPMWHVVAVYAGESYYCMKLNWLFLVPAVVSRKLHHYFVKVSLCLCSIPFMC